MDEDDGELLDAVLPCAATEPDALPVEPVLPKLELLELGVDDEVVLPELELGLEDEDDAPNVLLLDVLFALVLPGVAEVPAVLLSFEEVELICAEPYVLSVAGVAAVVLVVVDTPAASVDDLVVWLQPLRIRPRSAVIKTVFFIGD